MSFLEGSRITERKVMVPEEVAAVLGVGMDKTYGLIHAKRLPHIKIGRRYFIPVKAFDEWLIKESAASVV